MLTYADCRVDYQDKWTTEYNRSASIWDETNVIGVTKPIFNDTVCVSKTSENITDDFKVALQKALINIGNSDEGKKAVSIYSHEGYQAAQSSDYDTERDAQQLIKELSK